MKLFAIPLLLLAAETAGLAQLSADQKLSDFQQLIGLFNKRYAPYDWKKQVFQVDLADAQPWLDRVAQTTNDLDYYELCIEYANSLHDGNSQYFVPSNFYARLGMTVNVVESQAIISAVDRSVLPVEQYPFEFGDLVVSLDGKSPQEWVNAFLKYLPSSSGRTALQMAASLITGRRQAVMPHAADLGDQATLAVLRSATGKIETYSIPWIKTGVPLSAGPVPTPKARVSARAPQDSPAPSGRLMPVYRLPDGFQQRMGRSSADPFFTGSYIAGGHTIGYLRMGDFTITTGRELQQLDGEISWFQQNTDGMILDAWAMGGSDECYAEQIAARFFANPFQAVGYSVRATRDWISFFEGRLNAAPAALRDQAQANLDAVISAYARGGLTDPLPLCSYGLTHAPLTTAYTKPVVLLVNEVTMGPAEFLAAMLQDGGRATIFGAATGGIGTVSSGYASGSYAEGYVYVSTALAVRPGSVTAAGFPTTSYIENVGVQPDAAYDVFTLQNAAALGGPYVAAFTQTLVGAIEGK